MKSQYQKQKNYQIQQLQKEKNNINNILNNDKTKKRQQYFLYAIKNRTISQKTNQISVGPICSNFALAITKQQLGEELKIIQGSILEQQKNKSGVYQLNFDIKNNVNINQQNSLLHFQINCIQSPGKITIIQEDFRKFMSEFKTLFKCQDSQDEQYSDSNSNFLENMSQVRSSQISVSQRGRGRPKGSKTKKKQDDSNSSDDQYLETDNKNNQQKRGRGRPKGAKNKKKSMGQELEKQTNLNLLFTNLFSVKSLQEINNRVLKLRQKQQYQLNLKKQQFEGKRGRGRPKGVRNKPKVCNDQSQSQELITQNFPKRKPMKPNQLKCCNKCSERLTKKLFIDGKNVPLEDLKNLGHNLGVQDDSNVILNVINQQQLLKKILTRRDYIQNQFIIPWQVNSKLQICEYTVRTRKQHLIKNKRQGIYALLQDCYRHEPKWWKVIGVQRILQNLPNTIQSIDIYKILTQNDSQLIKEINLNIPTLIRNGNQYLSTYLIQNINKIQQLNVQNKNYGYSRQHLQSLSKTLTQFQFKKISMLKQNFTQNFCSPIHCAAINSNGQLLTYIVKHLTDFNVGDSLGRKPIHYAAMVDNIKNIQILTKYGADLKDIDKRKMTPLMLACKKGHYKNIKFILQKVRDAQYINFKSDQGLAAIHYAVIGRHQQCLYLLIQDQLLQKQIQTKQGMNILHLASGTGQKQVVKTLLQKGIKIEPDNYRRTPLMLAIRNNQNDIFFSLFQSSTKYYRRDFSHNTLLHYAAAYGNVQVVKYLLQTKLNLQTPNKKNFYPYQIAVLKGHIQCAKLLQNWNLHYNQHLIIRILKNPRGTEQFYEMFEYLVKTKKYDLNYQLPNNLNYTPLHYICSISEQEYNKIRVKETSQIAQKQYEQMQEKIINMLLEYEANPQIYNDKNQLPVHLCIQNENLIGIKLLLKQIPFHLCSQAKANNFIYYLTNLTCLGVQQTKFVLQRLKQADQKVLRQQLRNKDWNGFTFLLYLVKRFVQTALPKFSVKFYNELQELKQQENKNISFQQMQKKACLKAFEEYVQHQNCFIDLVNFLVQMGADPQFIVTSPKMQKQLQNYRKWGIQHFLMKFPSPKLLKIFMKWIDTSFNMQNTQGRTPLHLFCKWNKDENIFNPTQYRKLDSKCPAQQYPYIKYEQMKQYQGKKALEYLLQKGLTSNVLDINRSTPLLYSAINGQIAFINLLRTFGSSINNVNTSNQIPLIEIIKKKSKFTTQQIQSIMTYQGAKPDFKDLNDRNSLHHLVSTAKNFDTSPQICKLLFQHGVSINSLDKFNRSPIFYCFINIQTDEILSPTQIIKQKQFNIHQDDKQNDKVQILQTLLNHQQIDLNVLDIYNRTPLHYACEKNFFFSILYLLDKNIDYDVQDSQGNTPLAICLKYRKLNQAALLIKKGVRYGHVIQQGIKYSYFSYAINKLSVGICFMLIDHGYPLQKALEEAPNEVIKMVLKKRYV